MILLNFDIKSLENFIVNRKGAIHLDRIKAPLVFIFIRCQIGSSDFHHMFQTDHSKNGPPRTMSFKVTSAFIPLLFLFYYNNQIDKCYMYMCTITGSKDAR